MRYFGTMRATILAYPLLVGLSVQAQDEEPLRFVKKELSYQNVLPRELKDSLQVKDLSRIWTSTPNWAVYGFIGDDYQRLRIKLIKVDKDPLRPDVYHVQGKTMFNETIRDLYGELTITNIRSYDTTGYFGIDALYRDSSIAGRFVSCGTYALKEESNQPGGGVLTGTFASYFYITSTGEVRYDNIDDMADGYCNDQFVGQWSSYDARTRLRCNWGDRRIPFSQALDGGAGEFSPEDKYLPNGWQSYRDAYVGNSPNKAGAIAQEQREWWK